MFEIYCTSHFVDSLRLDREIVSIRKKGRNEVYFVSLLLGYFSQDFKLWKRQLVSMAWTQLQFDRNISPRRDVNQNRQNSIKKSIEMLDGIPLFGNSVFYFFNKNSHFFCNIKSTWTTVGYIGKMLGFLLGGGAIQYTSRSNWIHEIGGQLRRWRIRKNNLAIKVT